MSRDNPKHTLFGHLAIVAKSIAHPHRLELLEQLAQGERSVEILAGRTGLSIANASQHLQQLRRGGLVTARRHGKFVLYRLTDTSVIDLIASLRTVAERQLAEVNLIMRSYFHERDGLEPVSRKELMRRIKEGAVTVLDVRPEDEYALGHLPGAVNMPLKTLARQLKRFDRSREIVAYCRGPYCVLSFDAVALLREKGFRVRRLEDGYPEWRAAGLPIESASDVR